MFRRLTDQAARWVALLLLVALPLQGWATSVARDCLARHGGAVTAASMVSTGHHAVQAMASSAHAAHHGHPAPALAVDADEPPAAAPDTGGPGHAVAGHCSACASCAGMAALPTTLFVAHVAAARATPVADRSVPHRARIETRGLERPPRSLLA